VQHNQLVVIQTTVVTTLSSYNDLMD